MTTFTSRELSGWGRFPVQECCVARPEKIGELKSAAASDEVLSVLARGLGRSYGDAALNEDSGVLLCEKLDRFLDFDAASGVLHAEGGVSFAEILETFVPRGWFLPVTPGPKFVTLGGAIACDVHGKNHHRDGCLSNFIEEIELLLASGEVLVCSKAKNPDAFWATVGGLGLTGIVLSAKLRLQPIETSLIQASYKRTNTLDETLEEFTRDADVKYSVAWIDCLAKGENLGRSVVIRGEHAPREALPPGAEPLAFVPPKTRDVPFDLPDALLNPFSIRAFNALYYAAHSDREKALVPFEPFFWPLDAIGHWNRIYGARGFIQYQCVLPFESSRDGLVKLLEKISSSGHASFLAVLKTFGAESQAPLGFPFPGHTLALDIPSGGGIRDFAHQLDEIVLNHGGRVYLAKDATLDAESVRTMYPRLEKWERTKSELDPQHRFQSSLARRLRIGTSS
jgi:FAD/FMN-containing dehydrogenase